eukprot:SAG31_NODE_790_length_12082_cov_8.754319_4_plen_526_part_00
MRAGVPLSYSRIIDYLKYLTGLQLCYGAYAYDTKFSTSATAATCPPRDMCDMADASAQPDQAMPIVVRDATAHSTSSASSSSSSSTLDAVATRQLDEAALRQATAEAEVRQAQDAPIVAAASISAQARRIHGTTQAPPTFLQPGHAGECVAMASYPRSGNSMLRALLEGCTGVVTGSDSRPDRNMARDLALYGLVGEGDTGNHDGGGRVWIVKTHFPERYGWRNFGCQRAILLVRNPVNAIRSYFNMLLTGTHTHSIAASEYSRFADIWTRHVKEELIFWLRYHRWWLEKSIPMVIIRYEDLADKDGGRLLALHRTTDFLYGKTHTAFRSATGAIQAVSGDELMQTSKRPYVLPGPILDGGFDGEGAGQVYKPRAAPVSTDWTHYTPELKDFVLDTLSAAPELGRLGYCITDDAGDRRLEPIDAADRNASWHQIINIETSVPNVVWCNTGPPMRPTTAEDPHARGFQWKWDLRKIIKVEARGDGANNGTAVSQQAARREEEAHVENVAKSGVKEGFPTVNKHSVA